MQLMFLGSGSAFCVTPDNYQSNVLLTSQTGKRLLIDCGTDIRFSLAALDMGYRDIDDIYISHLHADHVGGLEYLGFSTMFDKSCGRPGLYISESIENELWNNCLSGGMNTVDNKSCNLSDYFSVHSIAEKGKFAWEGTEFTLVPADHVEGKDRSMFSYGLFFKVGKHSIYLTTDTRFMPQWKNQYLQKADLILHDCETLSEATGVHAHYKELLGLPDAIRKKMWLYHFNDGPLPDCVADGFCGFIKRGQVFELPD